MPKPNVIALCNQNDHDRQPRHRPSKSCFLQLPAVAYRPVRTAKRGDRQREASRLWSVPSLP